MSIPLTITRYLAAPSTIYRYVTRYKTSEYLITSRLATAVNVDYYDDSGGLVTSISYPTQLLVSVETVLQGVYVSPQPPSAGPAHGPSQPRPRQFMPRPVTQPAPVVLPA